MRSVLAAALLGLCACGGAGSSAAKPEMVTSDAPEPRDLAESEGEKKKLADPNFPDDGIKSGWAGVKEDEKARIATLASDYLAYVGEGRTTRQSRSALVAMATQAGAKEWDDASQPKPGELLLWQDATSGSLALLRAGTTNVAEGLNVVLASHDAAIIRLTPNPIYEESGLTMLDTSILGSLDLESWLHTPLALSLYGAPGSSKGKAIDVVLGDDPEEPVFTIPDLLPHLSRKVQRDKLVDSPERLDAVAGFTAKAVKTLFASHGVPAAAFGSLEATLVPAGKPWFVGVDKALIAGANHASRAPAFAAMKALLEGEARRSTLLILMGSDERFYAGAGAEAHIQALVPRAIESLDGDVDALDLRRILACTRVLMFDHTEGKRNEGVVLGTRRDDSSPSAFRHAIRLFQEASVVTQLSEKSGWSQAREVASLDIDTVAIGLPIAGAGRPYQLLSTFDLYQLESAFFAWVAQ